jgi:o-succinylbenzoate synthase
VYTYKITKHRLDFIKPAKTSRNTFLHRDIWVIELFDAQGNVGRGEASPLSLLSVDDDPAYEQVLKSKLELFCANGSLEEAELNGWPSIRFGIETAMLHLKAGSDILFNTAFTRGEHSIPINGLVWMNEAPFMLEEAFQKIATGFNVIKIKVGALDFDEECRLLEQIREKYNAFKITLRLDANGGFKADEAQEQLEELKRFEIHSIEQPIATKQWDNMAKLCKESPIPIALDEELIGVEQRTDKEKLLDYINPQYIILKPNLVGGFTQSSEWVELAQKRDVKWWATSALESNIGLNAIAQWVSQYNNPLHQGLGTGALFKNNFDSRLKLESGFMRLE